MGENLGTKEMHIRWMLLTRKKSDRKGNDQNFRNRQKERACGISTFSSFLSVSRWFGKSLAGRPAAGSPRGTASRRRWGGGHWMAILGVWTQTSENELTTGEDRTLVVLVGMFWLWDFFGLSRSTKKSRFVGTAFRPQTPDPYCCY